MSLDVKITVGPRLWVTSFIYKYETSTTYPLNETMQCFKLLNKWCLWVQSALPKIHNLGTTYFSYHFNLLKWWQKSRIFCHRGKQFSNPFRGHTSLLRVSFDQIYCQFKCNLAIRPSFTLSLLLSTSYFLFRTFLSVTDTPTHKDTYVHS